VSSEKKETLHRRTDATSIRKRQRKWSRNSAETSVRRRLLSTAAAATSRNEATEKAGAAASMGTEVPR
jgi:hypothetical protein